MLFDARLDDMFKHKENGIMEHFSDLENKFQKLFLKTTDENLDFVRNSFGYFV